MMYGGCIYLDLSLFVDRVSGVIGYSQFSLACLEARWWRWRQISPCGASTHPSLRRVVSVTAGRRRKNLKERKRTEATKAPSNVPVANFFSTNHQTSVSNVPGLQLQGGWSSALLAQGVRACGCYVEVRSILQEERPPSWTRRQICGTARRPN